MQCFIGPKTYNCNSQSSQNTCLLLQLFDAKLWSDPKLPLNQNSHDICGYASFLSKNQIPRQSIEKRKDNMMPQDSNRRLLVLYLPTLAARVSSCNWFRLFRHGEKTISLEVSTFKGAASRFIACSVLCLHTICHANSNAYLNDLLPA